MKIPWAEKLNKAEFYGTIMSIRQVFFDFAASRPDLFDVGWSHDYTGASMRPWNPLSRENELVNGNQLVDGKKVPYESVHTSQNDSIPGYLDNLQKSLRTGGALGAGKYRFLVVLTGLNGLATSGMLFP